MMKSGDMVDVLTPDELFKSDRDENDTTSNPKSEEYNASEPEIGHRSGKCSFSQKKDCTKTRKTTLQHKF